jgi:hypothetical protein
MSLAPGLFSLSARARFCCRWRCARCSSHNSVLKNRIASDALCRGVLSVFRTFPFSCSPRDGNATCTRPSARRSRSGRQVQKARRQVISITFARFATCRPPRGLPSFLARPELAPRWPPRLRWECSPTPTTPPPVLLVIFSSPPPFTRLRRLHTVGPVQRAVLRA